jgi:hypothetical protein
MCCELDEHYCEIAKDRIVRNWGIEEIVNE